MELTPLQRKALRGSLYFRAKKPTLGRLFWKSWRLYLTLVVAFILFAVVVEKLTSFKFYYTCFALGLLWGVLIRDIGSYRKFLNLWPVLSKVLNWNEVDALLKENPK